MADDRLTLKKALEEIARALGVSGGAAQKLLRDACSDYVASYGDGIGVGPGREIVRQQWQDATLWVDQNEISTGAWGGIRIRNIEIDGNDLRHWLKERQAASASKPASVQRPPEGPTPDAAPAAKGMAKRRRYALEPVVRALRELFPDGLSSHSEKESIAQVEAHLGLKVSRRTFGRAIEEYKAARSK